MGTPVACEKIVHLGFNRKYEVKVCQTIIFHTMDTITMEVSCFVKVAMDNVMYP